MHAQIVLVALLSLGFASPASLTAPATNATAAAPPAQPILVARSMPTPVPTAEHAQGAPRVAASPRGGGVETVLAAFAAEGSDPVLIGAGDIADCATGAAMDTARLIEGIRGVVFTAGDEAYPEGSPEDFAECYEPSWGRFLDRTLPTIGNHEYITPDAAGYFGYFGSRRGSPGRPWYSLDIGAWHVVVLDSDCDIVGCGPGSVQLTWLEADLGSHAARCTLAIWHHPRFSSGGHGNGEEVAPFWRALMAAGADVVVNGHDHDYERFAPQTPGARLARATGIREFVVGTGGASLRQFHRIKSNSRVRMATHGVLRLTLRPTSYTWRFLGTDGSIGDRGTTSCH